MAVKIHVQVSVFNYTFQHVGFHVKHVNTTVWNVTKILSFMPTDVLTVTATDRHIELLQVGITGTDDICVQRCRILGRRIKQCPHNLQTFSTIAATVNYVLNWLNQYMIISSNRSFKLQHKLKTLVFLTK